MNYRCKFCHVQALEKLLKKYPMPEETKEKFLDEMLVYIANVPQEVIAPEVARIREQRLGKLLGINDFYKEEKHLFNQLMLDHYSEFKEIVQQSTNPFETALRFAVAGNIIDFGAGGHHFDVHETIEKVQNTQFAIDHSKFLQESLTNANTVLYLGDNAGEIVMDKLFIETIGHKNLYFAVRGGAILNDATMEDAVFTGIDKVAQVISNGYNAPSTIIEKCTSEFENIFNKADVIISKGQGNLEGLWENKDKHIFFLLMAKCEMIAEILEVKKGCSAVKSNRK